MERILLSAILIFTVSGVPGCSGIPKGPAEEAYRLGPALVATSDPLVPKKEFPAWNPPKQFAVYRHLHKDRDQNALFGGEWILLNLTEGGWYSEGSPEREPVPDAEISAADLEAAKASLGDLRELVIPYRVRN